MSNGRFRLIYWVPREGVDPASIKSPQTPTEHRARLAGAAYNPSLPASTRAIARDMLAAMGGLTAEEEAATLRFFGLTEN